MEERLVEDVAQTEMMLPESIKGGLDLGDNPLELCFAKNAQAPQEWNPMPSGCISPTRIVYDEHCP